MVVVEDCATAAVVCHLECDNGKVNLNGGGEGWRWGCCDRARCLAMRTKLAVDALPIWPLAELSIATACYGTWRFGMELVWNLRWSTDVYQHSHDDKPSKSLRSCQDGRDFFSEVEHHLNRKPKETWAGRKKLYLDGTPNMNLKLLNFKVGVSSKFWGGVEWSGGGGGGSRWDSRRPGCSIIKHLCDPSHILSE